MHWTQIFDLGIGIGVVFLQISSIGLLIIHLMWRRSYVQSLKYFLRTKALLISFISLLFAFVGSMIYSNIIGFAPCVLCWWQRIFLFPQVFILGIAMIKKDVLAAIYGIPLSLIGAGIALYHYLVQKTPLANTIFCEAIGSGTCSSIETQVFGYITIPMMSLTVFVFIILVLLTLQRKV